MREMRLYYRRKMQVNLNFRYPGKGCIAQAVYTKNALFLGCFNANSIFLYQVFEWYSKNIWSVQKSSLTSLKLGGYSRNTGNSYFCCYLKLFGYDAESNSREFCCRLLWDLLAWPPQQIRCSFLHALTISSFETTCEWYREGYLPSLCLVYRFFPAAMASTIRNIASVMPRIVFLKSRVGLNKL